ncbi:MAG: protease complex subunit PrcB family protein [Candidatus Bathyarchaeia archaeon]
MGQCTTTGHAIEIKEIIDTGLSLVVKVEKLHPGSGCMPPAQLHFFSKLSCMHTFRSQK